MPRLTAEVPLLRLASRLRCLSLLHQPEAALVLPVATGLDRPGVPALTVDSRECGTQRGKPRVQLKRPFWPQPRGGSPRDPAAKWQTSARPPLPAAAPGPAATIFPDGTSQQALYTAQGEFLGYFRVPVGVPVVLPGIPPNRAVMQHQQPHRHRSRWL